MRTGGDRYGIELDTLSLHHLGDKVRHKTNTRVPSAARSRQLTKCIGPGQPAQSAQPDLNRYFLQIHVLFAATFNLHFKSFCSVVLCFTSSLAFVVVVVHFYVIYPSLNRCYCNILWIFI